MRYVNHVLRSVLRYNLPEEEEWTTLKLFRGRHYELPDDATGVIYVIHLGILVKGGFITPGKVYGQVPNIQDEHTTLTIGDIICITASEYYENKSALDIEMYKEM